MYIVLFICKTKTRLRSKASCLRWEGSLSWAKFLQGARTPFNEGVFMSSSAWFGAECIGELCIRGPQSPSRQLTNFMVHDLYELFSWYGVLAERAERTSLATKIITKGRFSVLATFSGLVDLKYNLQDYLEPTKPKNTNDYPLFYREIRALKSAHF
jgi:hypothetical protein